MKKNIFKKIFIKFSKLLGFEIIDQGNLTFPVSNKKDIKKLSNIGEESLILPMGRVKIKRPVKSLDIICDNFG